MGRQVLCDRCGAVCEQWGEQRYKLLTLQKKYRWARAEYETNDGRAKSYYFCPGCIRKFEDWIKGGDGNG